MAKKTKPKPETPEDTTGVRVARGGRNDEPVYFDELGRDPQLLGLARVIAAADPPLVIGVHGNWGTGKTSFMKVMQALLGRASRADYHAYEQNDTSIEEPYLSDAAEKELKKLEVKNLDVLTVWFNPWEHQFEDEPVMPLLDAIRWQQADGWTKVTGKIKRVVEDPKFRIIGKAALGVMKMAGPGWLTALTQQIGDEAREVMNSFGQFRVAFEECMKELTADSGNRLVIFIDDLDRCEAPYVVKILEALKLHLLNKHCIFVLGCADERVEWCLCRQLEIEPEEAHEYIEKIVQLPVHLPRVWERDFDRLLRQLGWARLADEKQCFDLLRAFAESNPRRLKRFLHWYELQRSMVEVVPGLKERADAIYGSEPIFLKMKLLQFADPRGYQLPADFERDLPQTDADEAPDGEEA